MSAKLCPKIILEGTRLTFKTEIAFALNEHPRIVGPRKYRYHSPIVSAEWCGFTNFPWGRGLVNFEPHDPVTPETLPPLPIKKLGQDVILTDGHTRALAAHLQGWQEIRVYWDEDDLDWEAYAICVQ